MLKGTCFESVDSVKKQAMKRMKTISEDDLQHCFQQLKICMDRCRNQGGVNIEDNKVSNVKDDKYNIH